MDSGSSRSPSPSAALNTQPPMLEVVDYNPNEGEEGAPITARIRFHSDSTDPIHVRLVVGNKAVSTEVRELDGGEDDGMWLLEAAAPAIVHVSTNSPGEPKVAIVVQALDPNNFILASSPVGSFTYWDGGSPMGTKLPLGRPRAATMPSRYHDSMPSPSFSDRNARNKRQRRRQSKDSYKSIVKEHSLMRTRHDIDDSLYAHVPVLEITTPLESICKDWDPAELEASRRLVRFHKIQDGSRVILSCEPISLAEWTESDNVVSCIYREETDVCYVTSVDIIFLLERLTNDEFPVEEKNRIRRNLEGLKPTTVSKHKSGSERFFQRIMDFPDPKPRNIEKDLKVFEWTQLGQALEKILSKYSIYTLSPTDSTASLPEESCEPNFVMDREASYEKPLPDSLLFSQHFDESRSPRTVSLFDMKPESESSSGSWTSNHPYRYDPDFVEYEDYLHEDGVMAY